MSSELRFVKYEGHYLRETVLQNVWSFLLVSVGFDTFC